MGSKKKRATKRKGPTFDELASIRLEHEGNKDLHRELEMAIRDDARAKPKVDVGKWKPPRKKLPPDDENRGYA